ncbi:uncharacterized component of anaerobic dehydrogenase [Eggerthella sp. YY7918]|nr:uncharacterized component of anaerobic dehydrogenase [Eggerthella sp. YY7918]
MGSHKQPEWYFASSDMYQILGYFVTQTSRDLAQALFSGALLEDIKSIGKELGIAQERIGTSLEALEKVPHEFESEEDLFHAVRKDYTHLFSNPTFSAMTLYESRMSGPDKDARGNQIFFGRTIPSIRELYKRIGFTSSIEPQLREDHAAVEFEAMQVLRRNQGITLHAGNIEAFEEISSSVNEFATHHVGTWAVSFFKDVEKHANEDVYRAMGRIGAVFMQEDLMA